MKAKLAIAAFLVFGAVVLGYAHVRGYPPFTSKFVQTCERAIKERLEVPSSYERISVEESKRTITYDEFFTDPVRAVSEATQKIMIQVARVPPVQYVALIDYQAREPVGPRQRTTCIFNSLEGDDTPTRTRMVQIDGEYNGAWAMRQGQPKAAALLQRMER